ncbi:MULTISPECIES: cytochrome P450 [unclassified Novosphingobium]|uniref:cytochrome P450 n=1 Tax=unclassified Novosphingobium TaxID=2644732 RepID=UPI001494E33A|nr:MULTISPECIES: cytochrome P450 [unclassified Novosphingobium]MBB3358266.1 cytochrome P450 [Novosphingobium sp. BK256]MBB3374627.1 cytochrome P450 [Novosphingobium sp. BK280]MBB3379039.1 cytochrome P450 [Novosphingobium sp. BK258]MBB3420733.1 cytochrome P450 [Novosphingobium sp. BK267]MBB3448145.1 cytochrome P450 [Novosphingobium sp. BK352]
MDSVEIGSLGTLAEFGFTGGRDSIRPFAERVFAGPEPRFLQDQDGNLAVFRNADLQKLGALPQIGNVPAGVLFGESLTRMDDPTPPLGAEVARVVANQVFTANPPIHRPVRKALVSRLGPREVSAMRPVAEETVQQILDDLAPFGEIDVMSDVAERLTCGFWGRMLEMDADEIVAMQAYTQDLTRLFHFDRNAEDYIVLDNAMRGYWRVIRAAAERSLRRGENLFVVALADDLRRIELPDDPDEAGIVPRDVGAMLAGNLIDGFHTAALGAANTLFALLKNPDALARVVTDRQLVTSAIFEALRIEPPVIHLPRWAMEEVIFAGVRIPRGAIVSLMWGIGGFDPAAVTDPLRFDLDRSRKGSTTFGGGQHICPGRYVAVMLIEVLLDAVMARGLTLTPGTAAPQWIPAHAMGQMERFPLRLVPAT